MHGMHGTITKRQIASIQIHRALECYGIHNDYVSTLTLAGAADEICGAELKRQGISHALDEHIQLLRSVESAFGYPVTDEKNWRISLNRPRNELKHWNDPKILSLTLDWKDEAEDMLDRAITNFITLYEDHFTDQMHDFIAGSLKNTRS